jgi:hypothetical protein
VPPEPILFALCACCCQRHSAPPLLQNNPAITPCCKAVTVQYILPVSNYERHILGRADTPKCWNTYNDGDYSKLKLQYPVSLMLLMLL